jgi:thiol-disulfide isomerase/thioredoxin
MPAPPAPSRRPVLPAAAALVAAALALAGCSAQDALAEQSRAGDAKGFVAGDGSVTVLAPQDRGEPVELAGESTGEPVDVAGWRGDVVVVNVWYAACAPCVKEAPDLAAAAEAFAEEGVRFVGVNTRDGAQTAQAFERRHGIGYPSVLDAGSGAALLALRGQVPPQAVPTTLVLDRQGRVSARVLGVAEPSTLRALVEDALAEPA